MLGSDMLYHLNKHHTVFPLTSQDVNITQKESLYSALNSISNLEAVINCAAFTHVDACETEKEHAFQVNNLGVRHLAEYCQKRDRIVVHFSTDYVFDGEKESPYMEEDTPNPINIYGLSKLKGEEAVLAFCKRYYIFRVQWLYGKNGRHFIKSIVNLTRNHSELSIVTDQWGSPSWSWDLARCVEYSIEKIPYGIYHLANQGFTTWYDFARFFLEELKINCSLKEITTENFPRPAKRPFNSRLSIQKYLSSGGLPPLHWKEAVRYFLKEYVQK